MKIKATVSFAGRVTMKRGEIREISDEYAADLISAAYAVPVENNSKSAFVPAKENVETYAVSVEKNHKSKNKNSKSAKDV